MGRITSVLSYRECYVVGMSRAALAPQSSRRIYEVSEGSCGTGQRRTEGRSSPGLRDCETARPRDHLTEQRLSTTSTRVVRELAGSIILYYDIILSIIFIFIFIGLGWLPTY